MLPCQMAVTAATPIGALERHGAAEIVAPDGRGAGAIRRSIQIGAWPRTATARRQRLMPVQPSTLLGSMVDPSAGVHPVIPPVITPLYGAVHSVRSV